MANKKGSKLRRCMKSLLRLLGKPKDMYVHAMTACSNHFPNYVEATMPMGFPTPNFTTLPRSFTVASSSARSSTRDDDDDLKHFLRSGSVRSRGNHVESEHGRKQQAARLPRSCSIGRIDEDKPCEFGYDINVAMPQVCPRSRSYAVGGRRGSRVF